MSDKKLLVALIILFLIPFASAEASFTFYSGAGVDSVCPRSTGLFTDVIENDGDEILEFSVTNSDSAAVFTTTVPTGFILFPGEIRNIYSYITPMSSIDTGFYDLRLTASANGITEGINHPIEVRDCYGYGFVANDVQQNICPCESAKFSFDITNNGEYAESYVLGVDGEYRQKVVLSQNSLTLDPGESKEIFAYAQSDCEDLGDYEFSVVVDPTQGRSIQSQTVKLVVDPCYDFDVDTERDLVNMCEHSTENVLITVENDGSNPNTYDLELSGPLWANLDKKSLEIPAGSSDNVELELIPDYGVEGAFEVVFSATPERGVLKAVNVFNVNVRKCHDVSVFLEKDVDKICNALENTYNVVVRNQGEFSKEFFVDVDGPAWASLDTNSLSLGAGEEQQLTLSVAPTYDVAAGEYDVVVNVAAKDSNEIASSAKIDIQTVTREECYDADLTIEDSSVDVYYDSSATVPVIIENKGADVASYSLAVSGTSTNFVYLNPSVVDVNPGESEIVYLYVAPSSQVSEGAYSATVTVRLEDATIMASESVDIVVTGTPNEGSGFDPITGDYIEEEESGTNIFAAFFNWIASLFGGGEEVDEEETQEDEFEDITGDVTDEEVVEEEIEEETPEEEQEEEVVEEEEPEVNETEEVVEEEEEVEEEMPEEVEEVTTLIGIGDSTTFMIGEEEHTIKVATKSGEMTILLEISSDPVFVPLDIGDTQKIDLDDDGTLDLEVSFNGFVGDKADISYKVLHGGQQADSGDEGMEEVTGEVTEETEGESSGEGFFARFFASLGSIFTGIADYWLQLLVLIVIIVVVILLARTNLWSRIVKFFEEEEVEEEKVIPASDKVVKKEAKVEEKKEEKTKKEEKPKKEDKKDKEEEKKRRKEEKKQPAEEKKPEEEEDEFVIEFDDDD